MGEIPKSIKYKSMIWKFNVNELFHLLLDKRMILFFFKLQFSDRLWTVLAVKR